MSSQGFSFPPPPPPPPQQQQHHPNQQQHQYHSGSQYGQSHHNGQRGGRGGGGHHRGRGRGYGNRGTGRGGYYGSSDASHHSAYPTNATSVGYAPVSYPGGYTAQPIPNHTPNIPSSQYPTSQSSHYQHPNAAAFPSPQPFNQPAATPYQHQPSYDAAYNTPTSQTTPGYSPVMPPHQHASPPVQPPMMGPPMRWGFEQSGFPGSYSGAQRGHARGPRPFNPHANQSSAGDRQLKQYPNKRDHTSAFGKPQSVGPRTPAPPPVPSFGNPLPSKPPPPADAAKKPKKKKRKHNQLGLTPKTEDHESSEEEDDVDEESRLAPGSGVASAPLQFTYRGQTSNLQSPADIAAWIAERKKRFPTQAKAEEKKKAMEEAKKAREEALNQQREARKQQESKRPQKEDKALQNKPTDAVSAAEKAKQKADKLRRKLAREERRVAKAEADAEQARLKVEALQNKTMGTLATDEAQPQQVVDGAVGTMTGSEPHALDQASDPSQSAAAPFPSEGQSGQKDVSEVADETVDVLSSDSDSSDWTSSSGSELSSSDSEDSDDDSAPEEVTSRREGPERVAPPPREGKKRVCRHFARNGRCLRGDNCKFSHEVPERGFKAKPPPPEKKGRKGLLQSLLERDKEDETRRVMETITWLGENGMLEEPAQNVQEPAPMVHQANNSGGEETIATPQMS